MDSQIGQFTPPADEPRPIGAAPGAPPPFEPVTPPEGFPPPPQPAQPSRWRWRLRWAVRLFAVLFALLVGWLLWTAPLTQVLRPSPKPSLLFLSSDGKPIARRGGTRDQPVDATRLPIHVRGAFIAIEDRRFRHHWGIDLRGIARAMMVNLRAGGMVEGGSTITQQLAKTAFLSADRKLSRKLQEALVAVWLEAWLSKDEILSRYLSTVYFGDGVYGLRAAAHHYFNRAPERLTVAQAAMLAGLLKAPSRLAPTRNLAGARARAKLVVAAMADTGVIGDAEARRIKPARLSLGPADSDVPSGSYFTDWLTPATLDVFDADYGETRVATTLDSRMQAAAGRVIRASLARGAARGTQAAMVAMRPDGRVVAMVGGRDYRRSAFNRATQARRQPGSAFKLAVYLAALRDGLSPDDLVEDRPLELAGWAPRNSGGRYRGMITLREAFAESSNVAAVRLSERVGRGKVIAAARDLGIASPLKNDPSLALGTSDVTLLELTSAYAAIAGGAYPVTARGLRETSPGWRERLGIARTRIDRGTWQEMLDLLHAAANEGTGRAAALRTPTFGKTGTTQDHRDALFVGFSGDLVVGVWVGNDDNRPMRGITGGGLPARIWRDFMRAVPLEDPDRHRGGLLEWLPNAFKLFKETVDVRGPEALDELADRAAEAIDYIERLER